MLFDCRPKVLHRHCLQFLLGVKMAPRETENNAYAKFWGDKQRTLWYVMVFLEWSIQGALWKKMIKLDTILHINRVSMTTYKMNSKCSSKGNVQTLIFSRNVHHKTQLTLHCLYRN